MSDARGLGAWNAITDQTGIDELLTLFGNFHDACIREIHVVTGTYVQENLSMTVNSKTTLHMLVQRQSRQLSAIELRAEELVALRLEIPPPDHENIIYSALLFIRDGTIYWIPNGWLDSEPPEDGTWIAARKLSWREASVGSG